MSKEKIEFETLMGGHWSSGQYLRAKADLTQCSAQVEMKDPGRQKMFGFFQLQFLHVLPQMVSAEKIIFHNGHICIDKGSFMGL